MEPRRRLGVHRIAQPAAEALGCQRGGLPPQLEGARLCPSTMPGRRSSRHISASARRHCEAVHIMVASVQCQRSQRTAETRIIAARNTTFNTAAAAQGHRAPVADLAVDGSGGLLASGSADRSVRVWDVDRGYCTHAFEGHTCGHTAGAQPCLSATSWRCSPLHTFAGPRSQLMGSIPSCDGRSTSRRI